MLGVFSVGFFSFWYKISSSSSQPTLVKCKIMRDTLPNDRWTEIWYANAPCHTQLHIWFYIGRKFFLVHMMLAWCERNLSLALANYYLFVLSYSKRHVYFRWSPIDGSHICLFVFRSLFLRTFFVHMMAGGYNLFAILTHTHSHHGIV